MKTIESPVYGNLLNEDNKEATVKTYNVVAFMNVEADFTEEAENEDQAMQIVNERLNREGINMIRESGFIAVGDCGAVDCWEQRED